jgi:hypothetical protein
MKLMHRWGTEEPLMAVFQCGSKLIGLSFEIEI